MKWLSHIFVFLVAVLAQASVWAAEVSVLPESRILQFDDYALTNNLPTPTWVHDGPAPAGVVPARKALLAGTNHYHRTGWRLLSCRTGTARGLGLEVAPDIATNLAANLQNSLDALIESPVFTSGIGTIYFEAINSVEPTQLTVEYATNQVLLADNSTLFPLTASTNDKAYVWIPLEEITLSAASTTEFRRYQQRLNYRQPAKLRIRRSGAIVLGKSTLDEAFTVIDNIRVSQPPADVVVYDSKALNQSGNYIVRCSVSNADTNAPTASRVLTAYYRWHNLGAMSNVLQNVGMSPVGGTGDGQGNGVQYDAVLPPELFGGDLEFYIVCAFDGDWYQSPDYTGLGYAGYPSEARSPFTTATQTQHFAGMSFRALTVNSGTGGGSMYTNGQHVAISASNLQGRVFDRWTGDTQHVESVTSSSTTVTMPDFDIVLTATYTNIYYTLAVGGGSGGGLYAYGEQVSISASNQAGKVFDRWTGDTASVENVKASTTLVTMPAANVVLAATYLDLYTLNVVSGTGGGSYTNGQQVAIAANNVGGMIFDRWTGDTAQVASVTSPNTTVRMTGADIVLTATYLNVYTLTVNSGSGSGLYTNGQQVAISASSVAGKVFERWTGDTATVASVTSPNTTVTMQTSDIALTATYIDVYTLTVSGGSGGGSSYTNGQVVAVAANAPAAGTAFDRWTGATQYVGSVTAANTAVTMPPSDISITATYSNLYYTLTVNGGTGSGSYTNGQRVTIAADVPADKIFNRWVGATQYIASVTSLTNTVTMPPSSIALAATYMTVMRSLSGSRFLHFDDYALTNNLPTPTWRHEGPAIVTVLPTRRALLAGTNHYHSAGWRLLSCRTGTARGLGFEVAPDLATNFAANLQNSLDAMIESPVWTEGIGTIYFEAINNVESTQITVEYATNQVLLADNSVFFPMTAPTNDKAYVWIPLEEITLNAANSNDFRRYQQRLNYRQPAKLRIRRSGDLVSGKQTLDEAFTVIDNIRVSFPPSDVVVYKAECPYEPGYPAVGESIRIRCYVDNVDMNVPTESRAVEVYYRWRYLNQASNAWTSVLMDSVDAGDQGNGERFEAVLPAQTQVGDLEYYFVCNFDGPRFHSTDYTGLNYPYADEIPAAFNLRGGATEPDGREFFARLRPFKSEYGALYVMALTNGFPQPVKMDLVGDDKWRGMVPVRSWAVTNLSFYFLGEKAYETGAETFLTNTPCWSEQAQVGVGRLPYGGRCVEASNPAPINVTGADGGFAQVVFNTRALDYMASRAEYQNFNAWPAPQDYFSDTSGQDPRTRYLNTFNTWPTNTDDIIKEPFIGYPSTTNRYERSPFATTFNGWLAGSATYLVDRKDADSFNKPSGIGAGFRNVALGLKGGSEALGLGYVFNDPRSQVAAPPDGLKQFSFKARLSQPASNYDVAFNQTKFLGTNYLVRANMKVITPMSPAQPSVSLIGYYQNPENFYEFRITQVPDVRTAPNADKRLSFQLVKWVNGIPIQLGATSNRYDEVQLLADSSFEMALYTTGSSSTRIRCKYGANVANVLVATDSVSPITYGTYGFLSSDGRAQFSSVVTQPTTTDAVATGSPTTVLDAATLATYNIQKLDWFTPTNRFAMATGSEATLGIYSVIPQQTIGVYLQKTVFGSADLPSDSAWTKVKEFAVPDFGYTSFSVPVNTWESHFVKLQVQSDSADVVVDELEATSWHGKTFGSTEVPEGYSDWLATEVWVVSNSVAESHVMQFDHTRAKPIMDMQEDDVQKIRSPLLDNGMGMMEFDYRVLRAPAKLTVQYSTEANPTAWTDVKSFTSATNTAWMHASAYLGKTTAGFFRLIAARESVTYTNSLVEINNVVVWDEPHVDATSWKVYNAKITDADKMRVALDDTKACFLNNSQSLETAPGPIQNVDEPYVQTPDLRAGLGELTFNARAYTNNRPATVFIFATTNGWGAAPDLWFEIGRFQNITNLLYQTYKFPILNGDKYDAVRLRTATTNGINRACLEEIAANEPVFPGFDIVNVRALCRDPDDTSYSETRFQPLASDRVGVEAQISNIQLAPSNILMSVTYYIGTNVWGADNWPAGQTITKPMYPTHENSVFYRTSPTDDLPAQPLDQVVQYRVTARYLGGVEIDGQIEVIQLSEKQETFNVPSWYYPQDLNKTFVARGWSPYYIVYGVPLGAVWINEVNSMDSVATDGASNPYVEIAVPAGVDLAGWKIDLVTSEGYSVRTITLPAGLPAQVAVTNGYAFFVLGGQPKSGVPALPKLDYWHPDISDFIPRYSPGGLRLRRPLGMYEQAIAYDWDPNSGSSFSGTNWAARDPQKRFVYVGRESDEGSLSRIGSYDSTNTWVSGFHTWNWTPGRPNIGQTIPQADDIMPGAQKMLITSILNSDRATQDGVYTRNYTLKVVRGEGTNITYRADPWYRINSVKVNQSERLEPSAAVSNEYRLVLTSITNDLDVAVTVGLRSDISILGLNVTLLNWLRSFGDAPLVESHYNGRPLALTELYWLNANPTLTNNIEFMVTRFNVDAQSNVYATVKLALNNASVTNLQGDSVIKLQVKQGLADPSWTLLSQYVLSPRSFDSNQTSRITIANPFRVVLPGWSPTSIFCQGMIEMENPHMILHELITE